MSTFQEVVNGMITINLENISSIRELYYNVKYKNSETGGSSYNYNTSYDTNYELYIKNSSDFKYTSGTESKSSALSL